MVQAWAADPVEANYDAVGKMQASCARSGSSRCGSNSSSKGAAFANLYFFECICRGCWDSETAPHLLEHSNTARQTRALPSRGRSDPPMSDLGHSVLDQSSVKLDGSATSW